MYIVGPECNLDLDGTAEGPPGRASERLYGVLPRRGLGATHRSPPPGESYVVPFGVVFHNPE